MATDWCLAVAAVQMSGGWTKQDPFAVVIPDAWSWCVGNPDDKIAERWRASEIMLDDQGSNGSLVVGTFKDSTYVNLYSEGWLDSSGTQLTQASAPHPALLESVFWSEAQQIVCLFSILWVFLQLLGSLHIFPPQATNRGDNVGRARSAEKFHRHSERWNLAGEGTGPGLTPSCRPMDGLRMLKVQKMTICLWVGRELCRSWAFSSVLLEDLNYKPFKQLQTTISTEYIICLYII